jgi:hypothetical protein
MCHKAMLRGVKPNANRSGVAFPHIEVDITYR